MDFENFDLKNVELGKTPEFNTEYFGFKYEPYAGVCFQWHPIQKQESTYSGWSGFAPYCFNHLTKAQAAKMIEIIENDLIKRDLTRNQFDILGRVAAECAKIVGRPAPKLVWEKSAE